MSLTRPLLAAVLLLLPSTAGALDQAARPISGRTVIEEPGYYVLASDLSVFKGPIVEIRSDDVILDLGGNRITVRGPGDAITTDLLRTRIRITNGTIVGGQYGINLTRLDGRGRYQVDNMTLLGQRASGVYLAAGDLHPGRALVRDNVVRDSGGPGIGLSHFESSFIRDNVVTGAQIGIFVSRTRRTKISGNDLSLNGTGMYASFSDRLRVRNNRSDRNATHGIQLQDVFYSRVQRNEIHRNGGSGLYLGTAQENMVRKNRCMRNTMDGMTLASGSFFNNIRANILDSNFGCGVRIGCTSTGNIFNRNEADRNGSGSVCTPILPCLVAP